MPSSSSTRWVKWTAAALLLIALLSAGVVPLLLHRVQPYLRARIVEALENRFHARVELDGFRLSLIDGIQAEGSGLRIYPNTQSAQTEPLVRLDSFRFHAPLRFHPHQPIHLSVVELKGLSVHLPPRSHAPKPDETNAALPPAPGAGDRAAAPPPGSANKLVSFQVDRIECDGAELVLETDKPGKLPIEVQIAHLALAGISSGGAIQFDAQLTNPRPRGTIKTSGSFGALQAADLGDLSIQGSYTLEKADLGDFKDIAGTLDSTGEYRGTLRDLDVVGETRVPDFRLTHLGSPLPLVTSFHAQVDGTNGDTRLQQVEATLGRSHFFVQGSVLRVAETAEATQPGKPQLGGHQIALTVDVDRGRIEDFLRLASRSGSVLMTGDVQVMSSVQIPPGPEHVHLRMKMDGRFTLSGARFASSKIQGRIAELSLRGQGRPDDLKATDPETILSAMQSPFQIAGGVVTLPALVFTVPGARINLAGTYGMEGGALAFDGTAKMEASVSQMVGGWKGLLLSPADRYFKKMGVGTEVGIHIAGSRAQPEFGIDFAHRRIMLTPGSARQPSNPE